LKKNEPTTPLDRFRIEEEKINETTNESEKYYKQVIVDQTKILDQVKALREKEQGILDKMIQDFEKVEAEAEGEERSKIEGQRLTRKDMEEGRLSLEQYYRMGKTEADIQKAVNENVERKLTDLKSAIRKKGVQLLELEVKELQAEWEIWCASTFPAASMAERLKALLKALEASLSSGIGNGPAVKTMLDKKARELRDATRGPMPGDGTGWMDLDLAGLKRLRLNPTWPEAQLPALEKIITEAKTTERTCRVLLDVRDKKNPVGVMWN